ncbi:hypothetical protein M422DRAFT_266414 [Sphaerobolus stellatus SS14]|uniref:Heterokaryon incompatibility domain-containing protein n=1 Tax=Sphaerobolus stellatus (strain SS14) TaxID=990650 RepID=A0A0C9URW3_SPHS4|nr:hypothetical protein M422DRAFT_266414 [Sphaerobolus stellatus SS14]
MPRWTPETIAPDYLCPTCFDLDLQYILQPQRDRNNLSVWGSPRHWIDSYNLGRNRSCKCCSFLKSAFDTLLISGKIMDLPPGKEPSYCISIRDGEEGALNEDITKRKRKPMGGWEPSNSLDVTLAVEGKDFETLGRRFREEFEVELCTITVEDYSLLDMTYESDRLPALAGLASRFANYFPKNERYLAGLWESNLVRDLLWGTGGPRRGKTSGPSWSWASMVWGGNDGTEMTWEADSQYPYEYSSQPIMHFKQDSRLRIITTSVDIDGLNKYGAVSSGCIVAEGAICVLSSGDLPQFRPLVLRNVLVADHLVKINRTYDISTVEASTGGTIYALLIGAHHAATDPPKVEYKGLILKPAANDTGKFERIGTWSCKGTESHSDVWTKRAGVVRIKMV